MSEPDDSPTPIDPAFEKVRRKMVRLLALSIAVLFVGLIAVLSAVVYRSADRPPEAASAAAGGSREIAVGTLAPITLPEGASISETALDASHALLRIALATGGEELVVIDLRNGEVVSRHPIRIEGGDQPATPAPVN